jgi:hypothetical protein
MRPILLAAALLLLPPSGSADAQERDTTVARAATSTLPRAVAREAAETFNADATVRAIGPYALDSGRVVTGDLAVLDGPVTLAGHVSGRVVAINADVTLRPGAQVDGDLLVVGGTVTGATAVVRGGVRTFEAPLAYREVEDRLVPLDSAGETGPLEEWLGRLRARRERSGVRFSLETGKTYNRVEGLPIRAGPSYIGRFDWGELRAEALGVLRTAKDVRWDPENLGHLAHAEARLGVGRGMVIGARSYDEVRPVETWQVDADEVGLAAFFLRRDYRDYFAAHGGELYAGLFTGRDAELTVRYAAERWGTRASRDPFSVWRNGRPWRPNPEADVGRFHVAGLTLRVDTRNVPEKPRSGLSITADYEHGRGTVERFATLSPGLRETDDPRLAYGRGLLDVRTYSRVAPDAQVNLRLVLGGWLHGDALPAQRRLSVGGIGSLPGFDFREAVDGADVGQCSTGAVPPGAPAQCDRALLLQGEYRGDLRVRFLGNLDPAGRWTRTAQWVAFVDAGRGWLVQGDADDPRVLGRGRLPGLSSLRTDVGAGLDIGLFGVYVAKAVSEPGLPVNLFVRVRDRF